MIELSRRRALFGLSGLICAPAIVRVSSLMQVHPYEVEHFGRTIEIKLPTDFWVYPPPPGMFPITLDPYAERVLGPRLNALAERLAQDIMSNSDSSDYPLGVTAA